MSKFEADPAALRGMSQEIKDAASALDDGASKEPPAVDAGASTDAVSRLIQAVLRGSAATATALDDMADKINASSGAYGETENTEEARMEQRRKNIDVSDEHD